MLAAAAARLKAKPNTARPLKPPAPASTAPSLFALFRKNFLGMAYCVAHDRNASVHAALQQHFADFLLRAAVVARGADMRLQFMLALECREQGDVDETAGFERQAFARPQLAPDI